jgi:hypothetical protein
MTGKGAAFPEPRILVQRRHRNLDKLGSRTAPTTPRLVQEGDGASAPGVVTA